ncbi:hypothetical protein [Reinekea sp.]|jgi:hypothetical protein|uniref:hypothetical protein n=1 Tax=Reinekea sp. TaxID=1970455 RepID=UPI002A7F8373|nr:hypothetical protein [Reinekea sp.]
MLNTRLPAAPFFMTPDGSLNRLEVRAERLPCDDPLHSSFTLTAFQLVSRQALVTLIQAIGHPAHGQLRPFLTHFDATHVGDRRILQIFAHRFAVVIQTAQDYVAWQQGNSFQVALSQHWQQMQTLVIAGGLSSHQFGIHLASLLEELLSDLSVICSPWGGVTALYGLAQTYGSRDDTLVLDFGATAIKRGIAHRYGNRVEMLASLRVRDFSPEGSIRAPQLMAILRHTRAELPGSMAVAISLAAYLDRGHPFDYHGGRYSRLRDDCQHLASTLDDQWLPECGFTGLALLEHDSTAAALAFQFSAPAMMITLGTGLGSAPCPLA